VSHQDKDRALRPKRLEQYIGQSPITQTLKIYIHAALDRNEPLDHVLLMGPPGLGKTTLAQIIAKEMSATLHITSGPAIEKTGDLAALLTQLAPGDLLFIDEIHRISPTIEELLYPAMEDYKLDLMIGEGPGARSMRLDLSPFSLIGATTKAGSLTAPLRDRFGIQFRLQYYTLEELKIILNHSAISLGLSLDDSALSVIALRSRGTPRIALRLLKRIRDFISVHKDRNCTSSHIEGYLGQLALDQKGLDSMDRLLLACLIEKYHGGPVGLDTLAISLGESRDTLEDIIEPYLVQENLIQRTPRGRKITQKGLEHFHNTIHTFK